MKEFRIDCAHPSEQEKIMIKDLSQNLFRLNHNMPMTAEYDELLAKVFPIMGSDCQIMTPITAVRTHMVKIGNRVIIMPGCLMMSAGGITIDDDAQIAANVQLISNNHDLEPRMIITCKPVHICRGVWIGAGATILPGITIGENSVVGAGSVVTHNVEPDIIVAGNPVRVIRKINNQ